MKQVINIQLLNPNCKPVIREDSDWIDLRAAEDVHLDGPTSGTLKEHQGVKLRKVSVQSKAVPLGVIIKLPKGMEAIMAPRSSSFKNFKLTQPNSIGIIDYTYAGPDDQWHMIIKAEDEVNIKEGDRICQFRIQPSQKATVWQKLKWLFSNGVKLKYDYCPTCSSRGGLGHSGVK
jgi:dUTP pyrophosphatase